MGSRTLAQVTAVAILIAFSNTMAAEPPALHKAAEEGNIPAVQSLLAQGQDPNSTNAHGETPLHAAAGKGQYDVAKLLIAKGASVNARDTAGKTPLLFCAIIYETKIQEILEGSLTVGKDFSTSSRVSKLGPAKYVPYKRQFDLARLLVENAADVNAAATNGATPLMFAAQHGFADLIQYLVDHGAEVNRKNKNGITALHAAVLARNSKVAELLLARGADVNARFGPSTDGRTALILAIMNADPEMVSVLLSHGADASVADPTGKLPLQYAEDEEIRRLLEKGAVGR